MYGYMFIATLAINYFFLQLSYLDVTNETN